METVSSSLVPSSAPLPPPPPPQIPISPTPCVTTVPLGQQPTTCNGNRVNLMADIRKGTSLKKIKSKNLKQIINSSKSPSGGPIDTNTNNNVEDTEQTGKIFNNGLQKEFELIMEQKRHETYQQQNGIGDHDENNDDYPTITPSMAKAGALPIKSPFRVIKTEQPPPGSARSKQKWGDESEKLKISHGRRNFVIKPKAHLNGNAAVIHHHISYDVDALDGKMSPELKKLVSINAIENDNDYLAEINEDHNNESITSSTSSLSERSLTPVEMPITKKLQEELIINVTKENVTSPLASPISSFHRSMSFKGMAKTKSPPPSSLMISHGKPNFVVKTSTTVISKKVITSPVTSPVTQKTILSPTLPNTPQKIHPIMSPTEPASPQKLTPHLTPKKVYNPKNIKFDAINDITLPLPPRVPSPPPLDETNHKYLKQLSCERLDDEFQEFYCFRSATLENPKRQANNNQQNRNGPSLVHLNNDGPNFESKTVVSFAKDLAITPNRYPDVVKVTKIVENGTSEKDALFKENLKDIKFVINSDRLDVTVG